MFSVIVTIIAIALVTLLAIATIYYGTVFAKDGSARAKSARYLQEGNQLIGAVELYKHDHDGALPSGTNDEIKQSLIDGKYLKGWPHSEWAFSTDYAIRSDVTETACLDINRKLGVDSVPSCEDTNYLNRSICCTVVSGSEGPPSP